MTLQITNKYDPTNPDHIYYDLQTINNNATNVSHKLVFKETRSSPYCPCANDYYISVVRFELGSQSLPFMIPKMDETNYNLNYTKYYITLIYGGNTVSRSIIYEPNDTTIIKPSLVDGYLSNTYFYMYSPKELVKMFNATMNLLIKDLASNYPDGTDNPFLYYDEVTQLFSLCGPKNVMTEDPTQPYLKIWFNTPLHNILPFPNSNLDNQLTNQNYLIRPIERTIKSNLNLTYQYNVIPDPKNELITLTQDYSSLPIMNPIQSIVFTSINIPVIPGFQGVEKIYGSNTIPNNVNNSTNNLSNIITDFSVPYSTGNTYKNSINYEPTVYRLIDLYGMNPLTEIEIECFWRDKYNNLNPFYLANDANASIKIMFMKK